MKKSKVPILSVLGIALIFAAATFAAAIQIRAHISSVKRQEAVETMKERLPERKPGIPEADANSGMPILEIDGVDYAALLEIPSFQASLPVANEWKGDRLYASPARFCGSAYDHSLVIGGHDDKNQFSFCDQIEEGAEILITDMTGAQFSYTVSSVDRAEHAKREWLISSDHDLTLFCEDQASLEAIAVRCDFVYQSEHLKGF